MTTAVLEVRGLSIHYGRRTVLADVDLDIGQRGVTALVGPSGCGKSSFVLSLNRLLDLVPRCRVEGTVRLAGRSIHDPDVDPRMLRCAIGSVFQQPQPFPVSIRQNLHLPLREHGCSKRRERDAITEDVLRRVGLWDEVDGRLDRPALQLSGGQQQRLCLARALTLQPQVLLLDEPCSALDPLASATIEQLIAELGNSLACVIVTHNLAQARRLADDLAVFWVRDGVGCLVETGPAHQVFGAPQDADAAAYLAGTRG